MAEPESGPPPRDEKGRLLPGRSGNPAGRPVECSVEIAEKIAPLLGRGQGMYAAAYAVGVCPRSVYIWLERAADGDGDPFAAFAAIIKPALGRAIGDAEERAWAGTASKSTIRWLESHHKENWQPRQYVTHAGAAELVLDLKGRSDEELKRLAHATRDEAEETNL